jgi:hypothetical protein
MVPSVEARLQTQKADVTEHPEVFHHIGLLVNEPPGTDRGALYLVIRNFDPIAEQSVCDRHA